MLLKGKVVIALPDILTSRIDVKMSSNSAICDEVGTTQGARSATLQGRIPNYKRPYAGSVRRASILR
jgi:hypothetical protein